MDKVKLGNIAVLINGDRGKNYPSQADITDEGEVPFVNAGHLNGRSIDFEDMNYISKEKYDRLSSGKFEKGDILYCLRGSLGKKAIVNDDVAGAIASSLVIIRPDYEKIDGDYLMFSLDSPSIKEQLVKANNGSSQPNLSAASVREYQIELPSIDVQKEVVEKLAKVRNVIDERQMELNLLDNLIKARFVEMFGEETGDSRTVDEVCESVTGGGTPSMQHPEFYGGEIPFIKSGDVKSEKISSGALWLTKKALTSGKAKIVKRGSVIVVVRSAALLHEFHIAVTDNDVVINQDLKALSPKENILPEFLMWSIKIQEQKLLNKVQTMLTSHIRMEDLLGLNIHEACVDTQEYFLEFVKQVDKSKVAVRRALDETQTLYDSLMQEYFG